MATVMQIASISRRERNVNTNVGPYSKSGKPSDMSHWICIYPCYINCKKTISQGRKVNASKAVENPTCNEIKDVLANAGLKCEVEKHKVHPRELDKYEMLYRGRVRVQLKNDNDTPIKQNLPSRDSILMYLCETIPKLKTRNSSSAQSSHQESSGHSKKGKKK
jgi:signal recognition particle subunit SRP19